MPDLDLDPTEYAVKGRKEPILHPRWKVGVIAIILVFAFAYFMRPVYAWWWGWSDPFFRAAVHSLIPG